MLIFWIRFRYLSLQPLCFPYCLNIKSKWSKLKLFIIIGQPICPYDCVFRRTSQYSFSYQTYFDNRYLSIDKESKLKGLKIFFISSYLCGKRRRSELLFEFKWHSEILGKTCWNPQWLLFVSFESFYCS